MSVEDAKVAAERLRSAAAVDISEVDPDDPSAQRCLAAYYAELDSRFATGFDPTAGEPVVSDEMRPPSGLFLVATLDDAPVGSGVLRFHGDGSTEIKRLWVAIDVRGLGLGRRLLSELEDRAVRHGSQTVRLDTNRSLEEAIAMYRRGGYREVAAFNDNPYADHWFEKDLDLPIVAEGKTRSST
jgi:ribosomal protein S18 acetylase RimI-like enzyme